MNANPVHRLTIGDFELTAISDGTYHLDGGAFFGVVPKVMWERRVKADEKNLVLSGLNSVLAHTGDQTVVLVADFYRQGDGTDESFTAKMIVSDVDLAPEIAGVQNVWIQGIGCGSAVANFN